ncbi:hypothetical protein ACOSQ2_005325 [Xanthoceras sorbifolium]
MGHLLRDCTEGDGKKKEAATLQFGGWLRAQGFSSFGYSKVHQSDSEGAAIDKMEEIEQSREAARSTGAGDGLPHSDVMHISINLVETVANPPSQHVAIALDRMESSSLNLESTEVALKNARKSNSIVKPVLKIEKKKRAL